MVLDFQTYREKMMGCWVGKNIGGVLGAPFEVTRAFNDAKFYVQDLSMGPPPNDDLDLQIVWLSAVERYGRNVNASILGDYWINYVTPKWAEYGMGQANLRAGFVPPMSGALDNPYRNSCGCFIRSEIWACLAPGNPALATRYAFEDAIVDHADDGMQAEIFCAALESAAFVESDPYKLIDIGLSYVPEDSKFAAAIHAALDAKKEGLTFREAVVRIHNTVPGTFGVQNGKTMEEAQRLSDAMGFDTVGEPGMDAPENCAIFVAAWIYGKDFEERMLLCNSAGEDADCTCATLGAILGIIAGAKGLPEKWTAPLGDRIVTMCINKTWGGVWVPKTCTELAERILRVTPGFLGTRLCDVLAPGGYTINCADDLYCDTAAKYIQHLNVNQNLHLSIRELTALSSNVIRAEYPCFDVRVDLMGEPYFKLGEDRTFRVYVRNCFEMRQQEWAKVTVYTPDGIEMRSAKQAMMPLNTLWGSEGVAEFSFNGDLFSGAKAELIVDVQLEGRHSSGTIKVVMGRKG